MLFRKCLATVVVLTVTATVLAVSTTVAAPAPAAAHRATETTTIEVQECRYEYKKVSVHRPTGRYYNYWGRRTPIYEWASEWKLVEVCEWVPYVTRRTVPHPASLLNRIGKTLVKAAVCGTGAAVGGAAGVLGGAAAGTAVGGRPAP